MELLKNKFVKMGLAAVIGAVAGYSYYYFIGCNTGHCPITGDPTVSTIYGGIMGLLVAFPGKKKTEKKTD